jgi:cobalt/nickel transport system permease protein
VDDASGAPVKADHTHRFFVHGESDVHRLAPECKLVATLAFVVAVAVTPREVVWAFALDAAVLAVVAVIAHVPLRRLLRRCAIETPFLAFALFLPFIGGGERVDVWFLSLSVAGLWGAWNIVVKATLGVAATGLLGATTTVPELLRALDRLRLPRPLVAITSFMIRYGDLLVDDMRRMKIARESRGYDGRWLWQARVVAATAGTLFIRAYERGERVYVAMLSRGYGGSLPAAETTAPASLEWAKAMLAPLAATVICLTAVVAP